MSKKIRLGSEKLPSRAIGIKAGFRLESLSFIKRNRVSLPLNRLLAAPKIFPERARYEVSFG